MAAGEPLGLSAEEVEARVERRQVNDVGGRSSRSLRAIVRANLVTRFNAILGALLVVILVVGPLIDALFGVVVVANIAIGIIQELRAKRTLDRLAVLSAPKAQVVRDGRSVEVAVEQVVLDDVLELRPGDQVVVDGSVVASARLEIDESLLTGESDPVVKQPGDEVLSGSFVAAGNGCVRATRVGRDAYARALTEEAQRFTLVRSELRAGIDRILRAVTWLLVPTALLLVSSQLAQEDGLTAAIRGLVAAVGSMVPEGLVLLTSVAFAVGAIRLGRRQVLVQELASIEGLARVDVVCIDKTGTLTEGRMTVVAVEAVGDADDATIGAVLAQLALADPNPNASLRAVADHYPTAAEEPWPVEAGVPFSSARKWSAVAFAAGGTHRGTWVLGAPDVVVPEPDAGSIRASVDAQASAGRRVLLLARSPAGLDGEHLPRALEPSALVVLEERVRPDAAATLAYFAEQDVAVKVISGDHPGTVAAVGARLGLAGAERPCDARTLPEDLEALADVTERTTVFGRVLPHQKRSIVRALQARGHVVAMTGDGVNDVLALKDADIGLAMGAGSPAARSVAQLVLLDNRFSVVPDVVAEGRRVIANVERVANLFVTKTVYATLLALAVGVARLPFPFFPRHLSIVSSLTIGIPAFFLALAPNARRLAPGFVERVLRFAVPAGVIAAVATFGAYAYARTVREIDPVEARTTATIVLFCVGLLVLAMLARPSTLARQGLVAAMGVAFVIALSVPKLRKTFALEVPSPVVSIGAVALVVLAAVTLEGSWRLSGWRPPALLHRRRAGDRAGDSDREGPVPYRSAR
ncbi:HAD-IC family P-type ATPase [soil metagenome]